MAELTITPFGGFAPVALTLVPGSVVPEDEEWVVYGRLTNGTNAQAYYRLVLAPAGSGGVGFSRANSYALKANGAENIEDGGTLTMPPGWALFHRASNADTLEISFTGRKRKIS